MDDGSTTTLRGGDVYTVSDDGFRCERVWTVDDGFDGRSTAPAALAVDGAQDGLGSTKICSEPLANVAEGGGVCREPNDASEKVSIVLRRKKRGKEDGRTGSLNPAGSSPLHSNSWLTSRRTSLDVFLP